MKKVVLALALASLFLPENAFAQGAMTGQAAFEQASQSIFNWLRRISGSLDEFVASEKRAQLRQRLHELNESLYGVEASKLDLLSDMRLSTGSTNETKVLEKAVVVSQKLDHLKTAIHRVAILLREQFQGDGLECERLLSSATGERKEWLSRFSSDPSLLRNDATKREFISQGERAVESLRSASLELAKLTQRLDPN
jgi:hypothetical protein